MLDVEISGSLFGEFQRTRSSTHDTQRQATKVIFLQIRQIEDIDKHCRCSIQNIASVKIRNITLSKHDTNLKKVSFCLLFLINGFHSFFSAIN